MRKALVFCFSILLVAGCGKSARPSDDEVKTALQIDPNFSWQSFKADCSPITEVNGTTAKPGTLRVDVSGAIAPVEDLFVVVEPSVAVGNDFTSAASMSEQDQAIFGKAQSDEQTVLGANNTIQMQHPVDPTVKKYPVPTWPAHMGSLIQAKTESITVAAQLVAEPKGDGTYAFDTMQRDVPYKSMATLTPRSKLPGDTVLIGSPEWDKVAAEMQSAAAATKQPLQ
jgi:hypothetical protein